MRNAESTVDLAPGGSEMWRPRRIWRPAGPKGRRQYGFGALRVRNVESKWSWRPAGPGCREYNGFGPLRVRNAKSRKDLALFACRLSMFTFTVRFSLVAFRFPLFVVRCSLFAFRFLVTNCGTAIRFRFRVSLFPSAGPVLIYRGVIVYWKCLPWGVHQGQ